MTTSTTVRSSSHTSSSNKGRDKKAILHNCPLIHSGVMACKQHLQVFLDQASDGWAKHLEEAFENIGDAFDDMSFEQSEVEIARMLDLDVDAQTSKFARIACGSQTIYSVIPTPRHFIHQSVLVRSSESGMYSMFVPEDFCIQHTRFPRHDPDRYSWENGEWIDLTLGQWLLMFEVAPPRIPAGGWALCQPIPSRLRNVIKWPITNERLDIALSK